MPCAVLAVTPLVGLGQSSARIAGVDEPPELAGEPKKLTPPSDTLREFASVTDKMTSAQIAEAQKLSREWKPKK